MPAWSPSISCLSDRGREQSDAATSPASTHHWHHQELGEAWSRFSLGASRRNQTYLGFVLLASRIVKKLISVVLNHQICNSLRTPRETKTGFFPAHPTPTPTPAPGSWAGSPASCQEGLGQGVEDGGSLRLSVPGSAR